MEKEGKNTKVLRIRIDQELLDQLRSEAKRMDIDISSYVRWCIRTGLYMKDLNLFIRSTSKEEDLIKLAKK